MWRRVLVVWSASRVAVLSLGYLLTARARVAPSAAAVADDVGAGGHRLGLGLLHPHLARRLPARQARGVLPALPAGDPGRARRPRSSATRSPRSSSRTWRCWPPWLGLYVLARDRLSEEHARRSILYLVLSPYAFALAMAYSEGLFLAATVWMFVLSDRERDLAAVPLGLRRRAHARDRPRPGARRSCCARGGGGRCRRGCSPPRRWPRSARRPPGCSTPSAIRSAWCTSRPSGAVIRPSR